MRTDQLKFCSWTVRLTPSASGIQGSKPNSSRARSILGTYLDAGAPGTGFCAISIGVPGRIFSATILAKPAILIPVSHSRESVEGHYFTTRVAES